MEFFKFLLLVLSNQKGELNLGDNEESGADDVESLLNEANLDDSEEDAGQPDVEPENPEDMLESMKLEGNEDGASDLLSELNNLGFIHSGLPFEVTDMDHVKELIQKGYDYTQKTQEVSKLREQVESELNQERESFSKEREAFEQERAQHAETLTEYAIFEKALQEIQQKDPELLQEISEYYQRYQNSFNPVNNELKSELEEIKKHLIQSKETETKTQYEGIRKEWESQLGDFQKSYGPKLRKLGVRPDWRKVQDSWSNDPTNKMTVKQAFFAEYGEQVATALQSMSKLAEKRSRTATPAPDDEDNYGNEPGDSYQKMAFEIAKEL